MSACWRSYDWYAGARIQTEVCQICTVSTMLKSCLTVGLLKSFEILGMQQNPRHAPATKAHHHCPCGRTGVRAHGGSRKCCVETSDVRRARERGGWIVCKEVSLSSVLCSALNLCSKEHWVSPKLQLCSYIGLSPCLLFIVPVLSLWSLGGIIHLIDPEPVSPSDGLRAGTSHLIQSQSVVIVSHSLKGLFAFWHSALDKANSGQCSSSISVF